MKVIMHRGTGADGGSCVEFRGQQTRILVDLGLPFRDVEPPPLDPSDDQTPSLVELKAAGILPDVAGLYQGEERQFDAVLLSRSPLADYRFLRYLHPDIPIYMSRPANDLIEIAGIFALHKPRDLNREVIPARKFFSIGDFRITPFAVDQDAFDALAFLIETGGKRVFWSGDFRGHGRKRALFKKISATPLTGVDGLVMDIRIPGPESSKYPDERAVEARITQVLKGHKNITLLAASSQNIARIVAAYNACHKTNAILVVDIYTAFILDRLKKAVPMIPPFNWKNIRIRFLSDQAECLTRVGYRDLLYVYSRRKIDLFEITRHKNRILMMVRDDPGFPPLVKKIPGVAGATLVDSLDRGSLSEALQTTCARRQIAIERVQPRAQAPAAAVQAFVGAVNPRQLIPLFPFDPAPRPDLRVPVLSPRPGEAFEFN